MVALVCVVLAWLQNPGRITAGEAVSAARSAFADAGLADAEVDGSATRGVFDEDDDEPVDVWKTTAALPGGTVQLWLARSDGSLVFLDDRTADGAAQLLDDEQFERLQAYDDNPAVPRQVRRNVALTIAAALVAGMGWWLSAHVAAPTVVPPGPAPDDPPAPPQRRTRPLQAS